MYNLPAGVTRGATPLLRGTERPIGMGYVTPAAALEGTAIQFLVRDRPEPAHVVALPFYRGKR